jgi:catalase (peroxidase I)
MKPEAGWDGCRQYGKKYLGSPSIHVEAAQLLVARQPGIFALVVGLRVVGLHVKALVGREALLIVCLVGLRYGRDRDFGL